MESSSKGPRRAKGNTIAARKQLTVRVVAALVIINAIAIANVTAIGCAVVPDGMLKEPRKDRWKLTIENACIDLLRQVFNDLCAAAGRITGCSIGMLSVTARQDPRAMQKIVHQRVDSDQACANFVPERSILGAQQ